MQKKNETNAINILMPSLSCDSLLPDIYPNLDKVDLREVITTYILGSSFSYLTPILLLTQIPIKEFSNKLTNPYYDFDNHEQALQYLSNEDLIQLHNHSYETALILDAANQYKLFIEDKDTLFGQLNKLITILAYNSAKTMGTEEVAGEGGYIAIVNFMKYWDSLDMTDIPLPIIQEINLIKNLGSNKNEIGNIASCFSTRRESLLTLINAHTKKLFLISLNGKAKEKQICRVLNIFNEEKASLEKNLNIKKYFGYERRGITGKILSYLDVELECNNITELTIILKDISASEVRVLCEFKDNLQKIVRAISNVENIILLTTELSNEVFKSLLFEIKNNILDIINSVEDFQAIFIALSGDQCIIVCDVLKEQLLSIIKKPYDFFEIFCHLAPEQKTVIFDALKEKFPEIIQNISSFITISQSLTFEQYSVVYEAVKESLPAIINNTNELSLIFQYLTDEQRTSLCKSLKEKLPALIENASDVVIIFRYLTFDQNRMVYEVVKNRLPTIIDSIFDLCQILQHLSLEQCTQICESLKKKLPVFFKTSYQFKETFEGLTSERYRIVCKFVKEILVELVKNASDFKKIIRFLTSEQRSVVYEILKKKLPALIKTVSDFYTIFKFLNFEQRSEIYEVLKEKLPRFINNASDFRNILEFLTSEQRSAIYESLKRKRSAFIKSSSDFMAMLQFLSPDQCIVICEIVKEKLPTIIEDPFDFKVIFRYLTPVQLTTVCKVLKEKLLEIIITPYDFKTIIEFLSPEQCNVICEIIKEKLSIIISNNYDFKTIVEFLTPEQHSVVRRVIEDKLPIEKRGFNRILSLKSQRYCVIETNEVFEALKAVQNKSKQLKKGLITLFFSDISQKKRYILDEISEITMNILLKRSSCNNVIELNMFKQIIENKMPILKKHRGFIKVNKTTSNQIVIKLLKSLEEVITAHITSTRMGMISYMRQNINREVDELEVENNHLNVTC